MWFSDKMNPKKYNTCLIIVHTVCFVELQSPLERISNPFLILFNISRIPFTIQRLCELLTDPKRNYTGTDKFLRGLEKVSNTQHLFV